MNKAKRLEDQALIAELGACPEISSSEDSQSQPVNVVWGKGVVQGTYVCRELVIAYAAWISPAFHLKVLQMGTPLSVVNDGKNNGK